MLGGPSLAKFLIDRKRKKMDGPMLLDWLSGGKRRINGCWVDFCNIGANY